jgi:hypothetical protein
MLSYAQIGTWRLSLDATGEQGPSTSCGLCAVWRLLLYDT